MASRPSTSSASNGMSRASHSSRRKVSTVSDSSIVNECAPDPGDGLGELGHRVVVIEHRAVAGATLRDEAQPGDPLLGGLDRVQPLAADGQREATDLADRLGAALEELGVVVDEEVGALQPAGLLVGEEREHHVARWPAGPAGPSRGAPRASSRPCSSCRRRRVPIGSRRRSRRRTAATCQSSASAGTTSRWPWMSKASRLLSSPAQRATTLARPGSDSCRTGSRPASVSRSATHSAAARSLLVGLEVSNRSRSRHSSTTSSAAWSLSGA